MEEFFTRSKSNEGRDLPLFTPDGKATEHTIRVRGIDSDVFKAKEADLKKLAVELSAIEDKVERDKAIIKLQTQLVACLVVSWSFDMECTETNVVNFLTEAPQIADAINRFAANRKAFFS